MGSAIDFLNRKVEAKVVYKDKPVIKEVVRKVEADCPPSPECDSCCPPTEKVVQVDTLKIKGGGDIFVKPKKHTAPDSNKINGDWIYGDECEIHTPQLIISCMYAVTSINNLQPSHLPPDFDPNPLYPKGCNERNYKTSKGEQGKILRYSTNFKPTFLINTDNTAMNGAIIVDTNGVVLGGNGRTIILLTTIEKYPNKYLEYIKLLKKHSNFFGIEPEKIHHIKKPVLVRVIKTDNKHNCNYYSRILNEGLDQKMDDLSMAMSFVKSIGENDILRISNNVNSVISLRKKDDMSLMEIINDPMVMPYILSLLRQSKLINDSNRDKYTITIGKKERFTDSAEPLVKHLFFAMLFTEREAIEITQNTPMIKIEQIIGNLLRIKFFNGGYNFLPQLQKAIMVMALQNDKLTADAIYQQVSMYGENQLQRMQYLCLKLLQLTDRTKQRTILQNYVRLYMATQEGAFTDNYNFSPDVLLEKAFSEEDVKILANLGDRRVKRKVEKSRKGKVVKRTKRTHAELCNINFKILPAKNDKKIVVFCSFGEYRGYASGLYTESKYLLYKAVRHLLVENDLVDIRYATDGNLDSLLMLINKKYKTKFYSNNFEERNYGGIIRSEHCGDPKVKKQGGGYYIPAMFDKPKQKSQTKKPKGLLDRITTWIKKDLAKPYRWEE
jgi:hypothetical protein